MALSLETFEVRRMVDQLIDTVGSLVDKKGNTLTVHCAHEVGTMTADRAKTKQILLNLLSNAGKFTRNGRIELTIGRCVVNRCEMVEFVVSDTGIGMTAEQVSMAFDPFAQADDIAATRRGSGSGLGLALVSRFCDLMSGQVTVESTPGVGSRFIVRVPRVVAEPAVEMDAADAA
jgi:Amt family ammonium transporter